MIRKLYYFKINHLSYLEMTKDRIEEILKNHDAKFFLDNQSNKGLFVLASFKRELDVKSAQSKFFELGYNGFPYQLPYHLEENGLCSGGMVYPEVNLWKKAY